MLIIAEDGHQCVSAYNVRWLPPLNEQTFQRTKGSVRFITDLSPWAALVLARSCPATNAQQMRGFLQRSIGQAFIGASIVRCLVINLLNSLVDSLNSAIEWLCI
jgi:hypothetical protein